ncbi:Fic family protein [Methanolobus psychrotolerans]|uniref:Fic family protein n=1 Tax=Methanolobus psychrotolerans TaxID=1874706 RepID=UPI0013ECB5B2|nr:Fic/DOC family N-terminal domain-containing protein [Methanolobus psychrotolerans]
MLEPYEPMALPLDCIDWAAHVSLIGKANASLARYDGIMRGIVNPNVFLSPLITKEAVSSSRIEGTQASVEDVFEYEADPNETGLFERRDDIHEVLNYRKALLRAESLLEERPIHVNMIRALHKILLTNVRGRDKEPGDIRRIQNYIASPGSPIEEATFIPPAPTRIPDALSEWENYLHSDDKDPLVQLAVLKGQFELIHPFRDGNGRIGRMLIPLILYSKGLISKPAFYLSSYLEKNRDAYYDALQGISENEDWNSWIAFFLTALNEQSQDNCDKASKILHLYNEMKETVPEITRSQYSISAIDTIFSTPIFNTTMFTNNSAIPKMTAVRILKELSNNDLITTIRQGSGRRPAIYSFRRLMDITEDV